MEYGYWQYRTNKTKYDNSFYYLFNYKLYLLFFAHVERLVERLVERTQDFCPLIIK